MMLEAVYLAKAKMSLPEISRKVVVRVTRSENDL